MKKKLILLGIAIISISIFTTGCNLFNKNRKEDDKKIANESAVIPGIEKIDYKSGVLYHKFDNEMTELENGLDMLIDDSYEKTVTPGGLIDTYYYSVEQPLFYTLNMKLDYKKLSEINEWFKRELEAEGWILTDNENYSFEGEKDNYSLNVSMEERNANKNKYIYLSITVGETPTDSEE